jgi:hypothetical protein
MTDEEYCVAESVKLARSLPLADAVSYLRGLVKLAGDCEAIAPAREACMKLSEADEQLELIASPQAKLPFNGKDGAK